MIWLSFCDVKIMFEEKCRNKNLLKIKVLVRKWVDSSSKSVL